MFFGEKNNKAETGHDEAFHILNELERNTPTEIRQQRAHFRVVVKSLVTVYHANASQRPLRSGIKAVTGDLSAGGCRVMCPEPLGVGDLYLLKFDRSILDIGETFVRCVRCQLVKEDGFDIGFKFFGTTELSESVLDKLTAQAASEF